LEVNNNLALNLTGLKETTSDSKALKSEKFPFHDFNNGDISTTSGSGVLRIPHSRSSALFYCSGV